MWLQNGVTLFAVAVLVAAVAITVRCKRENVLAQLEPWTNERIPFRQRFFGVANWRLSIKLDPL